MVGLKINSLAIMEAIKNTSLTANEERKSGLELSQNSTFRERHYLTCLAAKYKSNMLRICNFLTCLRAYTVEIPLSLRCLLKAINRNYLTLRLPEAVKPLGVNKRLTKKLEKLGHDLFTDALKCSLILLRL